MKIQNIMDIKKLSILIFLLVLLFISAFGATNWVIDNIFQFKIVETKATAYLDETTDLQYKTLLTLHSMDALASILDSFCEKDNLLATVTGPIACRVEPYAESLTKLIKLTWVSTFVTEMTSKLFYIITVASMMIFLPIACASSIFDILRRNTLSFMSQFAFFSSIAFKFGLPLLIVSWASIWNTGFNEKQEAIEKNITVHTQQLSGLEESVNRANSDTSETASTNELFKIADDYRKSVFSYASNLVKFNDDLQKIYNQKIEEANAKNINVSETSKWVDVNPIIETIKSHQKDDLDKVYNATTQLYSDTTKNIPILIQLITDIGAKSGWIADKTKKAMDLVSFSENNIEPKFNELITEWNALEEAREEMSYSFDTTQQSFEEYYNNLDEARTTFWKSVKSVIPGALNALSEGLRSLSEGVIMVFAQALLFPLVLLFVYYTIFKMFSRQNFAIAPKEVYSEYKQDMNNTLNKNWKDEIKKFGANNKQDNIEE